MISNDRSVAEVRERLRPFMPAAALDVYLSRRRDCVGFAPGEVPGRRPVFTLLGGPVVLDGVPGWPTWNGESLELVGVVDLGALEPGEGWPNMPIDGWLCAFAASPESITPAVPSQNLFDGIHRAGTGQELRVFPSGAFDLERVDAELQLAWPVPGWSLPKLNTSGWPSEMVADLSLDEMVALEVVSQEVTDEVVTLGSLFGYWYADPVRYLPAGEQVVGPGGWVPFLSSIGWIAGFNYWVRASDFDDGRFDELLVETQF